MTKSFALVTGASQGLGKAIALELANRRVNLLLSSLPGEGLPELAASLAATGIEVHYFETDLVKTENVLALSAWVNAQFDLQILVNNAGFGGTKRFADASPGYLLDMIQLNIMALALLTRQLLPNLTRRDKAFLLNVSSMAAFSPIGYKTVYPASKAFVRHFTLGLAAELRGTAIRVSAVYPGPMMTNDDTTRRILRQGLLGKIGLLTPETVAATAIKGMLRGQTTIVPGWTNWFNSLIMRLLPVKWKTELLTRAVSREVG
jgi:hypothetical protein